VNSNLATTVTAPPFDFLWSNAPPGSYTLVARARDNLGLTTDSAPLPLVINVPPFVQIATPLAGSKVAAGGRLGVVINAGDPGGSVTEVQLLVDGNVTAASNAPPYHLPWTNIPLGFHTLTALATDNLGLSRTSAPVSIEAVLIPWLDIAREPGGIRVLLNGGETGRVYTLEISTNFGTWTPWSTNQATDGTLSELDPGASPLPFRYYRAVP
jgi:hypothetical protein